MADRRPLDAPEKRPSVISAMDAKAFGSDEIASVVWEHLGHTAAARAFVADEHRVARLNSMGESRVDRVLFVVKGTGAQRRMCIFLGTALLLDDRALRRKVAAQNGDRAVRPDGLVKGRITSVRKGRSFQVFIVALS